MKFSDYTQTHKIFFTKFIEDNVQKNSLSKNTVFESVCNFSVTFFINACFHRS
jgi:hypothetical protein